MLLQPKLTKKQQAITIFSLHFTAHQKGQFKEQNPARPYYLFRKTVLLDLRTQLECSDSAASSLFNDIKDEIVIQYPDLAHLLVRDPNITPPKATKQG